MTRRFASCALVATAAVLLVPGAATAQTNATLTPEASANGPAKIDFGEDRGSKTLTVFFSSSAPLDAAPAVTVGNTSTADGELFDGTATATADLPGKSLVKVSVVVDPGRFGLR